MVDGPVALATGGVRLAVRLTPKASRNRIEGVVADADGACWLKVSVSAVPENGKANAALIALLAKSLKIAKGTIAISAGATERKKILLIGGDAEDLRRKIADCASHA